jgi:hypothetical protein
MTKAGGSLILRRFLAPVLAAGKDVLRLREQDIVAGEEGGGIYCSGFSGKTPRKRLTKVLRP